MSESPSIGPYNPYLPHDRGKIRGGPKRSPLEKRAHQIAARQITRSSLQTPVTRGTKIPVGKVRPYKQEDLKKWLEDIRRLCVKVLKEPKSSISLVKDFHVIQTKVQAIHAQIAKELQDGGPPGENDVAELLQSVELELKDVQKTLLHARDDMFVPIDEMFVSFYEAFETQVANWNFLAEHPLYQKGECLQEHAYDSLMQYVYLEKRWIDLKDSVGLKDNDDKKFFELEALPPLEEAASLAKDHWSADYLGEEDIDKSTRQGERDLLQEARQSLEPIRSTFKKLVYPTLKAKIEESQKEYEGAVKALDVKSLKKRKVQESPVALVEDFSRFQRAIADLGYQQSMIESALIYLPSSKKKVGKDLNKLMWDVAIPGKSIETGYRLFLQRMEGLTQQEQSVFKQYLEKLLKSEDPIVQKEAQALLLSMKEVCSGHANPFFEEILSMAGQEVKKLQEHKMRSTLDTMRNLLSGHPNPTLRKIATLSREEKYESTEDEWQRFAGSLKEELKGAIGNINRRELPSREEVQQITHLVKMLQFGIDLSRVSSSHLYRQVLASEYLKAVQASHVEWDKQENDLVKKLKRPTDQKALGWFFLALQFSAATQGMQRQSEFFKSIEGWSHAQAGDLSKTAEHAFHEAFDTPSLAHEEIQGFYNQYVQLPGALPASFTLRDSDPSKNNPSLPSSNPLSEEEPVSTPSLFTALSSFLDFRSYKGLNKMNLKASFFDSLAHGNLRKAIALIKAGVDPNTKDAKGRTVMERALDQRDIAAVRVLVNLKADPNMKGADGKTPLDYALALGDVGLLEDLIAAKVDLDVVDASGKTPFQKAWEKNDRACALALVNAGANVIQEGVTLHRVLSWDKMTSADFDLVKILINKGFSVNSLDENRQTPLHKALHHPSWFTWVEFLLDKGADPNIQDKEGNSFFHLLASFEMERDLSELTYEQRLRIVGDLITKKGDIHLENQAGQTPFQLILQKGESGRWTQDIAHKLLEAGARYDVPDRDGNYPLALAQAAGMNSLAKAIQNKLDVDLKADLQERRQIYSARRHDFSRSVQLLKAGADFNIEAKATFRVYHIYTDARHERTLGTEKNAAKAYYRAKHLPEGSLEGGYDEWPVTPLHMAVALDDSVSVTALLKAGQKDPNIKDPGGLSLLQLAISLGASKSAQVLVDAGADLEEPDAQGKTPFQNALENVDQASAVVLLKAGAHSHFTNENGEFPLHIAVRLAKRDLLGALLDAHVDPNVKDAQGHSPLYYAVDAKEFKVIEALVKNGADVHEEKVAKRLEEALIDSIAHRDEKEALAFLKIGANPNAKDAQGNSALHLMAQRDEPGLIMILLEAGADPNLPNSKGDTPFHIAASSGFHYFRFDDSLVVKTFLDKGADVNRANQEGNTPFALALRHGSEEIMIQLLEGGGDPNARNAEGDPVLYLAAHQEHYTRFIQALIEKQADIHAVGGRSKKTAFQIALEKADGERGYEKDALILINAGAPVDIPDPFGNYPIHYATTRHLALCKALVKRGVDVNVPDVDGYTPLQRAVRWEGSYHRGQDKEKELDKKANVAIVRELIGAGALLNVRNLKKYSDNSVPLYRIVEKGKFEVLKILLEAREGREKVDINALNPSDYGDGEESAFQLALRMGKCSMAIELVKAGADFNTPDMNGDYPLDVARRKRHMAELVTVLEERGAKSRHVEG